MNQHDAMMAACRRAVAEFDRDALAALIGEPTTPFWIRRDAVSIVLESAPDGLALSVFDRLFAKAGNYGDDATALLEEHWVRHVWQGGSEALVAQARQRLARLAAMAPLSDRLFTIAMAGLAHWTQRPLPATQWRQVAQVVRALVANSQPPQEKRLADTRMLRAALWSGDTALMQQCANIGSRHATTPEQRLMVQYLVGNLVSFADRRSLLPIVECLHAADPALPSAIHNLALVYDALDRPAAEIAVLYERIGEQAGAVHFREAVNWIAQKCYAAGLIEQAARFFAMLPAESSGPEWRAGSWQQKAALAKGGALPASQPPALRVGLLHIKDLPEAFAAILERVASIVAVDMDWVSAPAPAALRKQLLECAETVFGLRGGAGLTPGGCKRAAQSVAALAARYFAPFQHYAGVSPIPLVEKYGHIDVLRLAAAHHGLMAISQAFAALGLECILAGFPLRDMVDCLTLLDCHTTGCLGSGRLEDALAMLGRYGAFGICGEYVRRSKERCFLELGKVDAARALLTAGELARSRLYALATRDEWSRRGKVSWQTLCRDGRLAGQFDVVWPDGRLVRYDHEVPPTSIGMARPGPLWLRRGEMITDQKGILLRPMPLHYPAGYPDGVQDIVARGLKAARLEWQGAPVENSEPVIVLENFDALHHVNYYHWCVLVLSRIHYVLAHGLLRGRRLVTPQGLKSWMTASLREIGIAESMIVEAPMDRELHLTDAVLISSVEFAAPSLLMPLVESILRDPPRREGKPVHLYLSRRGMARRPLINEQEIEAIAERLGFTIVAPETLTFAEQARLFRSAAGVAAPEGAALTNTMFCRPHTRVLSMLSQNDMFPIFNDLALVFGHHHRKLAGPGERDDSGMDFIWGPYRIDPALAEISLRWVMEHTG